MPNCYSNPKNYGANTPLGHTITIQPPFPATVVPELFDIEKPHSYIQPMKIVEPTPQKNPSEKCAYSTLAGMCPSCKR
jgi:hypothetical protein